MDITKFNIMKDGWFIGNFKPTAYQTQQFEVCYKKHKKGEDWALHYHKVGTEINYLVEGRMRMHGIELIAGDIFTLYPYEIADPIFLEDCTVLIIKTPSNINDKYIIQNNKI